VLQVTLLHVYHHASISFIWWMITHTAPGGDAYFSAALNSFVHVVMYTYYLLAILLGKDKRVRARACEAVWVCTRRADGQRVPRATLLRQMRDRYLWWGRYVTQFQMAQFCANLAQAWYCMRNSPYPRFMSELLLWYMVSLLFLFGARASGRLGCVWRDQRSVGEVAHGAWSDARVHSRTGSFYYSKFVSAPKRAGSAARGKKLK
jgi:elongation of very long chain fatty acids protein 4